MGVSKRLFMREREYQNSIKNSKYPVDEEPDVEQWYREVHKNKKKDGTKR